MASPLSFFVLLICLEGMGFGGWLLLIALIGRGWLPLGPFFWVRGKQTVTLVTVGL